VEASVRQSGTGRRAFVRALRSALRAFYSAIVSARLQRIARPPSEPPAPGDTLHIAAYRAPAFVTLDAHHTLILAILVLFLGRFVNRRIHWLREYGIPEPVTGGLIASFALTLLVLATGAEIRFELAARDTLLIVFFTTVGLSADLQLLARGGAMLVVLTVVAVLNLVVQNGVGVGLATLMGHPPAAGLLGGSAALSGGHGTVLAWGPIIGAKFDIGSASAMGAAAATFGLIAGGLLGGPLGHRLVTRHGLSASDARELSVGVSYEEEDKPKLDANGLLTTVLVIAIAIAVSDELNDVLEWVGFTLPKFVTALFCGMVLSNTVPRLFPRLGWPTGSAPLALVAEVALGLFLSMSLMTLNLVSLADVALPLFVILAAQVAVAWLLISHVVFRLLGSSYDAAVASSGYFGLAMGATPTAIAIMTSMTKKYGASPRSFLVVPLVGAFFVDISNAIVLQTFVKLLGG
jgi:ESS family glutamate:Na+ symporter